MWSEECNLRPVKTTETTDFESIALPENQIAQLDR